MSDQASRARNAAKCARCGHSRAKHTTNPADGCTAKVGRSVPAAHRRRRTIFSDCECRYFVERTP